MAAFERCAAVRHPALVLAVWALLWASGSGDGQCRGVPGSLSTQRCVQAQIGDGLLREEALSVSAAANLLQTRVEAWAPAAASQRAPGSSAASAARQPHLAASAAPRRGEAAALTARAASEVVRSDEEPAGKGAMAMLWQGLLSLAILGALIYFACGFSGPSCLGSRSQEAAAPGQRWRSQVFALTRKNVRVSSRTEVPMCRWICNTCCAMITVPILYVSLMTVLPKGLIAAYDVNMTGVDHHPKMYGRNYSSRDVWTSRERALEDYLFAAPSTATIAGAPGSEYRMWPSGDGQPAGACYCRTLGLVGAGADEFRSYLEQRYMAWRADFRERQGLGSPVDLVLQEKACPAELKAPIFQVFESEESMTSTIEDPRYAVGVDRSRTGTPGATNVTRDRLCGAVIFDNNAMSTAVPRVVVRTNVTGIDMTGQIAAKSTNIAGDADLSEQSGSLMWYTTSGFLAIQSLVEDFLVERRLEPAGAPRRKIDFVPLPTDAFTVNTMEKNIEQQLAWPQSAGIMFASLIMSVTYFLIRERNMRQKELMSLMGLYDTSLALSWLLLFAGLNFISSLGSALLIYTNLVERSIFLPLVLILWLTAMSTTALGMCVSTLFNQERLGALCASGVYFVLGYAYLALTAGDLYGGGGQGATGFSVDDSVSARLLYSMSIVPQVGFALCLKTYLDLDQQLGCTWLTMFTSYNKYSLAGGALSMAVGFVLYMLLYLYLDKVMQHDVGVAQPWYFPLQPSFWRELFGLPPPAAAGAGDTHAEATGSNSGAEQGFGDAYFEEEGSEQLRNLRARKLVVSVRDLKKEFRNAAGVKVKAVDGLNLTMYQGECFCLLGHNGAGKSTTMAVLTGMVPQTSGEVEVLGHRLPESRDEVRKQMGFCMQQNVLWDTLTVEEHVHLFGALIGLSEEATASACDEVLRMVELLPKRSAAASSLSGGMKRKLNVALALLGSPRVLFLDEPSAGMDPHTRRQLWEMLKQSRTERIVCLTTHYMDEADELGDRTCIMVAGRAACLGTNVFLKQKLGCGYMLNFVKAEEGGADAPILKLVRGFCGDDVTKASDVGRELRLRVPFAGAAGFPRLMKELDQRLKELRLESYGVGVSDLEDVFLKVASGESPEQAGTLARQTSNVASDRGSSRSKTASESASAGAGAGGARTSARQPATFSQQFQALFYRRMRYGARDSRMFACQLLLPCFIMVVAMSMIRFEMKARLSLDFPEVAMDTSGWNAGSGEFGPTSVAVGIVGNDTEGPALATAWQQRAPAGITEVAVNESLVVGPYEAQFPSAPGAAGRAYHDKLAEELAFADFATERAHNDSAAPQLGGFMYSPNRVTIFPNTSSQWAAPTLLSLYFDARIREARESRPSANATRDAPPLEGIDIASHPFGASAREKSAVDALQGMFMGTILLSAYSFVPAGIAAYVAMEREVEVKHQLMVSGTGRVAYWAANLAFDCVFGVASMAGTLIVFYFFGSEQWLTFPAIKATITLLLLFIPAVAVNSYVLSFLFTSGGGALVGVLMLNTILGSVGIQVSKMLILISETRRIGSAMMWVVQAFFPTACLGDGLMNIAMFKDLIRLANLDPFAGKAFGTAPHFSFLGDDAPPVVVAGDDIFMLGVGIVLFSVLVLVVDGVLDVSLVRLLLGRSRLEQRCPDDHRFPVDEDVAQERARVQSMSVRSAREVLIMDDVHKTYDGGASWAVRGVTYAVEGGQVFGLLGVNGAGKTTAFKMMCGQVEPSAGQIIIGGQDISQNLASVRRQIGYCPQFNALLDLLTVREHLELYGQLKGLDGAELKADIQDKLRTFELAKFENSRAGQLSGGNMRKLSAAIAVIGEPPIIFLDEPSAGMDPVARRHMWNVIQSIAQRREHNLVVLTTHSMEEADALCSKIAIQASGQVRCLGTPQQLKERHGSGLELNVRLESPSGQALRSRCSDWGGRPEDLCEPSQAEAFAAGAEKHFAGEISLGALAEWRLLNESADALSAFLRERCLVSDTAEVECVERFGRTLSYRLSGSCPGGGPLHYGELFELLEGNRDRLHLADFQLSQGTLERTFNRLAAEDLARQESV
mmetsp:Transcript_45107/g.130239  ORF Transcript_45107/g.130239 Transcript_45107/m.130239 type:complete len:2061 (+) Transcript_45107:77-6259(+)